MKYHALSMFLALPAMFVSTMLAGCSTNPATGKRQMNWLSAEKEHDLGAKGAPILINQYGGDIPSATIQTYVSDLGQRIAAVSERPDLEWEFHAVDSSAVQASALPGGKVVITRGLMEKLDSEAQLAGVLGHEVGHITAQHGGQKYTRAMIITGLGVGLGIVGGRSDEDWLTVLGVGTSVGGGMYLLSYNRSQETQADELGVRYMTRLGYNPTGQIHVMEVLKQASDADGAGMEFLRTHPYPDTRIKRLNAHIRENYPDHDNPQKYQSHRDNYRLKVLAELERLPPPVHDPKTR